MGPQPMGTRARVAAGYQAAETAAGADEMREQREDGWGAAVEAVLACDSG